MADLIKLIMDIRKGSWQPHEPQKIFKMNGDTRAQLFKTYRKESFADRGVLIIVSPTMSKDEVAEIVVGTQPPTPASEEA